MDVPVKIHNESVIDSGSSIYPFIKYDGESFLRTPYSMELGIHNHMELIKNLKTKASDILLICPMKTGTHWVHEILSMLLMKSTDYNKKGVLTHMILDIAATFYDKLDSMDDPRLFITHLPLHRLPEQHIKNGYKIIYVNRNPKDRFVSQYTFLKGKLGIPNWTWNEFFEEMVLQDDLYSGWFNFTKEFELAVENSSANIFSIKYEDLKINPFPVVRKLADYLDVSVSDEFVKLVIEKCSFHKLKENKYDSSRLIEPDSKSTLFRKGVIGDWKNWFTVTQNERFDQLYREQMKDCKVEFVYDVDNAKI